MVGVWGIGIVTVWGYRVVLGATGMIVFGVTETIVFWCYNVHLLLLPVFAVSDIYFRAREMDVHGFTVEEPKGSHQLTHRRPYMAFFISFPFQFCSAL